MPASLQNLLDRRAALLGIGLIALLSFGASDASWSLDICEHTAVVRELVRAPLDPTHPLLGSSTPHPGFSPYTLAVAGAARLTGLSVPTALLVAGIVNVALLLAGIAWLARAFAATGRSEGAAAAFYALLLTLLFWGGGVWGYSGFFHLRGLGTVAPYPSTFASGLAAATLALALRSLRGGGPWRAVAVAALTAVVLLSHPLTSIFLVVATAVCALVTRGATRAARVRLLAALGVAFALALAWPYWSILDLIGSGAADYDTSNAVLYGPRLRSVIPALAGLLALALRLREDVRDPLTWAFVALAGVYGLGALLERHAYGRVLSSAVLLLHIALALLIARAELRLARPGRRAALALAVVLLLGAFAWNRQLRPFAATLGESSSDFGLAFLERHVGAREVVLADLVTSWPVPAHAGAVVAVDSPLPFVEDAAARRDDVRRFFTVGATDAERREILARRQVAHVLLDRTHPAGAEIRATLGDRARLAHQDEHLLLLTLED